MKTGLTLTALGLGIAALGLTDWPSPMAATLLLAAGAILGLGAWEIAHR